MIDYNSILKTNPNGVLATQDGNKVKTRVFQYLFSDGNKVYFCTSNQKPVYEQIKSNPEVSFCTYPNNFSQVVSVNGRASFVNDLSLKTRILDENPGIKDIYNQADNPIFTVFYIDVKEIETFSFAEGSKSYEV